MPKEPIPDSFAGFPAVTAERMREVDRLAGDKYGLKTLELMENAGKAVAEETERFLGGKIQGIPVVVCCGRGANGGDGLVAARRLAEKGALVKAFLCPPKKEGSKPGTYPDYFLANLDRAKQAGVAAVEAGPQAGLAAALSSAVVVLDALLGTGSAGKPAGAIHHMISEIMKSKKPVLAVDIPSGVHPDTGYHSGVFITAAETLTLGLPKRGLLAPHAKRNVGELKVLDIGYPKELLVPKS
ncbi:MAG: NAD(P)H-hydrate epimerase [Elusimicrobia bacterium]|nr:NAD(P)H-hydrate epimerase [Elusimicrobiota bacterium]